MKYYMIFSFADQDYVQRNGEYLAFRHESEALRFLQACFPTQKRQDRQSGDGTIKKYFDVPYQIHVVKTEERDKVAQ